MKRGLSPGRELSFARTDRGSRPDGLAAHLSPTPGTDLDRLADVRIDRDLVGGRAENRFVLGVLGLSQAVTKLPERRKGEGLVAVPVAHHRR